MTPRTNDDPRKVLQLDRPRKSRIVRWLVAAIVGASAVFAGVVVWQKRAESRAPRYVTESVRRADVRVTVSATGTIQGLNTVEIGAEVTGKVLRVYVDYNDRVKKGQLLAEIDPEQLLAALEESSAQVFAAEANIRTARATLNETQQASDRAEGQAKLGLISQRELETAHAAAARAHASLSSATANASLARASSKSARSRLEKTKILAPSDGVVLARAVEPGQTVTAGFQTPVLFRLAEDLTKLSLYVEVDEADIGRVSEGAGATFSVDAYPQRTFTSKVVSLRNEPKSSQSVVSYEAVLTVDNSERLLRPGMTATATITSQLVKDVPVVPNAALRFVPTENVAMTPSPLKGDEKHIYVVRSGSPAPVRVKTGATDGHVTELVSTELAAGSQVIVDVVLPP